MAAPCFRGELYAGMPLFYAQHSPVRYGAAALSVDHISGRIVFVPFDEQVYCAGFAEPRVKHSVQKCYVSFAYFLVVKLLHEFVVRPLRQPQNEQPRGVHIQPVDGRKLAAIREHGLYTRDHAVLIIFPYARHREQAAGFVNDHYFGVGIHHVEARWDVWIRDDVVKNICTGHDAL